MGEVVHIAGPDVVHAGRYVRQRCAWCGEELISADLAHVATPTVTTETGEPVDNVFPTWPPGTLVGRDGPVSYHVEPGENGRVPETSCIRADPMVLEGDLHG